MAGAKDKIKWLGGCAGIFLLLIVISLVVLMIVSGNRLKKEMAASKAKGYNLTLDDMARMAAIPESVNGAPIYDKAFKLYSGKTANDHDKIYGELIDPIFPKKTPDIWEQARKEAAADSGVITVLEQAAAMPQCRFPVDWKSGPAALFPHMGPLRKMSRLVTATAMVQAHDGRMKEASESLSLAFQISQAVKDEPSLIGQFVNIAMIKIAGKGLREVIKQGDIPEDQARRLADQLARINLYPGFVYAMQGEKAMGLSAYDMIRKNPAGMMGSLSRTGSASQIGGGVLSALWRPFGSLDRAAYIRYMDKNIDAAHHPYRVSLAKDLFPRETDVPRYALVARIMSPVFSRASITRDTGMAELYGSRIFLGLHVYRQRYGKYPSSLKELQSKLGWQIPKDPMSGKDFIYKQKGKGFILYSFGGNMNDDKGIPKPTSHSSTSSTVDDIVWEMEK